MNITLAQAKFKTGDFEYNYQSIAEAVKKSVGEVVIFPQCMIEDLGGQDLILDDKVRLVQCDFLKKISNISPDKNIFLGDILISNGETAVSTNGFYEINGEKVYVSDTFEADVECDLYILAHNKYFVMNAYRDFIDSIEVKSNFVYVNAVAMADCNIYAGGSFVKNANNELIYLAPMCEEDVKELDFSTVVDFADLPTEEQVLKVTTYALKEYCENTGFNKVVLGLSGGIDSALTAALAVKAIGAENVLGILMPSMFSSEGSVVDALQLAENLKIQTVKEPITPLFDAFMKERELKHDLAEENLQARLRALILMFYSNRDNRLLLSTGNKSEAAMGFGTLYGDLAGGLNLICDLTKMNVYKLSNYINRNVEIIPQNTIDKAPSAELHPNQKDSDRLPEYAVLDDIIEMYLEQNKTHDEIYAKYGKEITDDTIKRIYRAQFKRKQGCLGVRLTERSFCAGVNLPVMQRMY